MRVRSLILLLAGIALATLACGLPTFSPRPTSVPVNIAATAAASQLDEQSEAALATIQAPGFDVADSFEELGQQLGDLQPDANGNIFATVTDDQLNRALLTQGDFSQDDFTIEDVQVQFTGGNIVLTGNMTAPIRSGVTATFRPELSGGLLQFTMVDASLGILPVPTSLARSVEQALNITIAQLMAHLPAEYSLQSVTVNEGSLTVVAHKS
jgi:hypothetical protein